MLTIKAWLFVAIGVVTIFFLWTWFSLVRRRQSSGSTSPQPLDLGIGFVTNFFDTLGIGSFATTTSIYKLLKRVRDEDIPGTLNVGHTVPVIAQAFIYIAIVEVDMTTLISLIAASVLGMWIGAGGVGRLPRRPIQIGMGIALLVAAALTLMTIYNKQAGGGEALGLTGASLIIAVSRSVEVFDSTVVELETDAGINGYGEVCPLGRGLTKARQIRDLCVSLGIAMTIENTWGGDIVTAAIAHLAHSTPPEYLTGWRGTSYFIVHLIRWLC